MYIMVRKAKRILDMLKRTFETRIPNMWKDLYVSLVRPHLGYTVQAWNPYLLAHIDKLESVQRRTTGIPTGFGKLELKKNSV